MPPIIKIIIVQCSMFNVFSYLCQRKPKIFVVMKKMSIIVACAAVLCMTACRQKSSPGEGKQLSAQDYATKAAADSAAIEPEEALADSSLFTYEMAMEIVQPGYKCDEKFIASLLAISTFPCSCQSVMSPMPTGVVTVRPSAIAGVMV